MTHVMSSILFLCTGNSCRSQMAEAWTRAIWPSDWQVYSAGLEKHGLNPNMLKVMEEAGVDMTDHYSKTLEELPCDVTWDVVVTVCDHAAENCPVLSAKKVLHIPFADPPREAKNLPEQEALSVYRRVRDEIRSAVGQLINSLRVGIMRD